MLSSAKRFSARIVEKGQETNVKTYQIAIGNGRLYGGGNVIADTAAIDDGRLDLYSLEMSNLWKSVLMARAFRAGTHGAWQEVRTARCVEFKVETRRAMPITPTVRSLLLPQPIFESCPARLVSLPHHSLIKNPELFRCISVDAQGAEGEGVGAIVSGSIYLSVSSFESRR